MVSTLNDLSIGRVTEPTEEQILIWEAIKEVVSPIVDGLYISGYPTDLVQQQARSLGISRIVSLSNTAPPDLPGFWLYRHPFNDDARKLPNVYEIQDLAKSLVQAISQGERILVHCAYGLNRSALVAAYVMKMMLPLTGFEIHQILRANRPGSLHNELFAAHVKSL